MISYEPFFETLKKQKWQQTKFIKENNLSPNLIQRMHKNEAINTKTLDKLCTILDCAISDIIKHTSPDGTQPDNNEEFDFILDYIESNDISIKNTQTNIRHLWQAYKLHNKTHTASSNIIEIILTKQLYAAARKNKTCPWSNYTQFCTYINTQI